MKIFLMLLLFPMTSRQTVLYNMPTNQIYIVDLAQDPIQIMILEENIEIEISCIQNEVKNLKDINFTNSDGCLRDSLNQAFDLNIQEFIDLKNILTKEKYEMLKKTKNLNEMISLYFNVHHSYSLNELLSLYEIFKKNGFAYETHSFTYFKINHVLVPIFIN